MLVCEQGHIVKPDYSIIKHRCGTVSALVYNVNQKCIYCELEAKHAITKEGKIDWSKV